MDLLDVAFLARWRLGRLGLEYGMTQMVPVRVRRKERFEEARRKRSIRKERGGIVHRFGVTYLLKT